MELGDKHDTDRCTAMAIVRNLVVGTWFAGTNSGGQDVVCCFAPRDGYGADSCTVMAIAAPNRVVRTTIAFGRLEIGAVLIVVRQWPLYESGWSGRGLLVCAER